MAPVPPRRHALRALAAALLTAAVPGLAWAQTGDALAERRVKAAYLYRFASYVEWPAGALAQPDAPLLIGIWGHDELADDLATLVAGRSIDGRGVEVLKVRDPADTDAHILFVAQARGARLAELVAGLGPRPVLVVTESPGALAHGSVINFLMDSGQVRFELSPQAAAQRGLRLSSRLIAVSRNFSGQVR